MISGVPTDIIMTDATDPEGVAVVAVRSAAIAFLTTNNDDHVAHPECVVLEVKTNGKLVKHNCKRNEQEQEQRKQQECSRTPTVTTTTVVIRNVWVLPTTAVVEYEKVSSGVASSSNSVGYVTLLLQEHALNDTTSQQQKWVVISVVMTAKSTSPVTPVDLQGPIDACWDRYCSANRACDGKAMAQVFHPYCRLAYARSATTTVPNSSSYTQDQEKENNGLEVLQVHIKSCSEFLWMVSHRYETEAHMPYATYHQNEPQKVAAGDTLQGVSMVAPTLALVRLKVGHPPFLWSDFLICAKIENDDDSSSIATDPVNGSSWWIVSKSSSSEPFMVERPDGAM